MIYAIRAVGTIYIKFGYTTKSPKERLKELQIGCPMPLELIANCEGDLRAETWIHWRLFRAKAHYRGEWFMDCSEVQAVIAEMIGSVAITNPHGIPSDEVKIDGLKRNRLAKVLDFATRKAGSWA